MVCLFAAWLLSCAPLLLAATDAAASAPDPDTGLLAICALPWLALAGLPARAPERGERRAAPAWWLWLAASAPVLTAAARADLLQGVPSKSLMMRGAALFACVALLAAASSRSRRSKRAHVLHSLVWFLLVVGIPIWVGVASAIGGVAVATPWKRVAAASPLQWAFDGAHWTGTTVAPIGCALLLLAISALPDRREERAR